MGTLNWTLALKSKIDMEVKQIGGMKNILSLKRCNNKETILLFTIMFESLDVIFMAPSANPVMVITLAVVGLYMYLTQGLAHNAALGFAIAGWIFSFFFKEKSGHELTSCAEKLFSKDKKPKYNVVAVQFLLGVGNLTGGNFKQMVYHLDNAIKYAQNHGEYLFGAYSCSHSTLSYIANGENFSTLLVKMKKRKAWLKEIKNHFVADFAECRINFITDMMGISKYNPQYYFKDILKMKCGDTMMPTVEGMLNYHKGDYDEALRLFDQAEPYADNEQGLVDYYELKFYHCLTLTYHFKKTGDKKYAERIEKYLELYKAFGELSPEYLEPRYRLLDIYYKSASSNDTLGIVSSLEDVLDSATKYGLVIPAAVTTEIILEYCDERNFTKGICRMYFMNLLKIWSGLSAKTKVDQLRKKYFRYLNSYMHKSSSSSNVTTTTTASSEDTTSEN
eukprot:gene13062-8270_t